jgi:hypothetical protein
MGTEVAPRGTSGSGGSADEADSSADSVGQPLGDHGALLNAGAWHFSTLTIPKTLRIEVILSREPSSARSEASR